MKGLILAGGHGTRLHPTTKVINKHLLMIYDKPMIFYPIMALRDAGIKDIVLTLGDHDCERFYELLGSGKELGVNLTYHYHGEPKGIAYAINSAREELGNEDFVVHLGDNIFTYGITDFVEGWNSGVKGLYPHNICGILTKKMPPHKSHSYGMLLRHNWKTAVVEKPVELISQDAVLGCYIFDDRFFKNFDKLTPSSRGEYEITDMINSFETRYIMDYDYPWYDCGTFSDLYQASKWRRGCVLG